jgi:glycosyltransferase involved in cell wall biosynthesis
MRLGINTLFLIPGEVGGSQTYLCETLKELAGMPGLELVLFTHLENDDHLRALLSGCERASFRRLNFRASSRYVRIIREQFELPFAAARENLDVLWSPGYTAPVAASCSQVVSILDMQYKRFPHDLTPLARFVTNLLVQMAALRCKRVLTISEFSKREIVQFTAAHEEDIDVTPLAASPCFGDVLPGDEIRRRLSALLPGVEGYLLCVANTYPHKNVETLVEAFGTLMGEIPHKLVLVGKPRLGEPAVQKALDRLANRDRVVRLPQVPLEDLAVLYQGADLFVFPSLYEGFGLPVLEAMLAGVPVLAARHETAVEVGKDLVWYFNGRDAGDLVRQARVVLSLGADERAARRAMSRKAASVYTWARSGCGTLAAIQKLLA